MAAQAICKSNVFFGCNGDKIQIRCNNRHGVSVFPVKSANFSCPKGIHSVKLRCGDVRSSSTLPRTGFYGRGVSVRGQSARSNPPPVISGAQMSIGIGKAQKWWQKGLEPNMREITGAQDLVESLLNAGDRLVVVDFFSPGCGGCKALHPKICQLAGMNPEVQFVHVNYEEHKSMCYSLGVHVLPFFRFYRGAHGRLCSFSCTNATIKKFKDALAKHNTDRCSLGPAKGLEEKELLALAANKELAFSYTPKPEQLEPVPSRQEALTEATAQRWDSEVPLPLPLPLDLLLPSSASLQVSEDKTNLVTSGR